MTQNYRALQYVGSQLPNGDETIMKKIILSLMLVFGIILVVNTSFASKDSIFEVGKGLVSVDFGKGEGKIRLSQADQIYTYDYHRGGQYPLQMGDGLYYLEYLKTSGEQYYVAKSLSFLYTAKNTDEVYLTSNEKVNWQANKQLEPFILKFKKNAMEDQALIQAYRDYILRHFNYNDETPTKQSNLKLMIQDKKGICYDFSLLTAQVLRHEGIKTKMVFGYRKDIQEYHAWNEVYIDHQWQILDLTVDLELKGIKRKESIFHNKKDYKSEKIY